MKIINISSRKIYDIELSNAGENQMPCPECSHDRKKKKAKSFSFNAASKVGYCQHCNTVFAEYNSVFKMKEYAKPIWKNKTELTDKAVKWFESRGISQNTLLSMKVYSDMEFMPQFEKEVEVICFPYFMDDTLVNIKYRGPEKSFKLYKDAELIFFNINCLKNTDSVIIVEGEIDCLSFIEAGMNNCISVPNGAAGKNLTYMDSYIDLFYNINTIYIATDNDIKGYELRCELIRRFGQEKCKIVEFETCKDANEVLSKLGVPELKEKISKAKNLPVSGIIDVEDSYDDCYNLYLNGMPPGAKINFDSLDSLITWELGRLVIVTGIPTHGKSEQVDFIVTRLNILHGWKVGYFSPENYPFKYHFSKLASKLIGKSFDAKFMSKQEFDNAFMYIHNNFYFIYPEDNFRFEGILDKALYFVKRFGIKQFVLDPYNKIEHLRNKGESETDYISRFLDAIILFAKKYQVLFWLVAHPTKMKKENGKYEVPNLYSISGSAHFYNKTDYGITVYRTFNPDGVEVHIQKVKFKHLGTEGVCPQMYNWKNGRYEEEHTCADDYDNRPYIRENCEVINYNIAKQKDITFADYTEPKQEQDIYESDEAPF